MDDLSRGRLEALVREHEGRRRRCINLIASENVLSPAVRSQLSTDLTGRYGDYPGRDTEHRKYFGLPYVREIESGVTALAARLFGARYVEPRPLSGHVAGAGVLMGLCRPGDRVLEIGSDGGGHRLAAKLAESRLIDLEVAFLPFDSATWNIDTAAARALIEAAWPRLVILGSSTFLFPHPVREIAETTHALDGTVLAYDASHVFGLIAAGTFQAPLAEGADVVFGSTHKTLPGPQGGLILTNDDGLIDAITPAVYPALVTNHHLFRLPALGLALLEMETWGGQYATATVANARRLGAELARRDLFVAGAAQGYTRSHTLLVTVPAWGTAQEVDARLERCGIIVTTATWPHNPGRVAIRLGLQEVTRLGAGDGDMPELADLLARALAQEEPAEAVAQEVARWALQRLGACRYTWADDGA